MVTAAKEGNEDKKMAAKTCATLFIVDVLIATTALYVGLAMLGHVQSDHGSAILTRKVAFITFVISDAITLISSISSALVAFVCWMNLKRNGNLNKSQKMAMLRDSGTMLALIAMVLAHISGTYALYVCSDKLGLGLGLGLGLFVAGIMISTTDFAQHTLDQAWYSSQVIRAARDRWNKFDADSGGIECSLRK